MPGQNTAFWILFIVIVGSALATVLQRNILHCALSLAFCFLGVAGYYALLQAEFLTGVQVLIYVGAITVLMIFAVMLTQQLSGKKQRYKNRQTVGGALAAMAMFVLIVTALHPFSSMSVTAAGPADLTRTNTAFAATTTEIIGQRFVTDYVWPFEIASIILLVALVGAIYIARDDKAGGAPE